MSTPLRVLIATDAFPPNCGGSGWSTFALTQGLRARGHHVDVVHVQAGSRSSISESSYEGVPVTKFHRQATTTPVLRNIAKNERLWSALEQYLVERINRSPVDILHAQHVMTTVPAIRAGHVTDTPVVATVRDYWPVCYWSDLIYDPNATHLCPHCTTGMMTQCVRPRSGAAWPAALAVIPYMRANLRTKRRELARANAIIAVSTAIARDLNGRAPELASAEIYTVPNPVDMTDLIQTYDHATAPMSGPYVLYAGKLATNKGVQFLLSAIRNAAITWPLVIVGDGPLRQMLEADARAQGIDARFLSWLPRRDVLAWMRHASLLAFPSYGPESLSRVLIEAAALGVPIAAMDTGGTRDIITPEVTGLLSTDVHGFTADLARLAADSVLRASLGHAALTDVRVRFDARSTCERVEYIYRSLIPPSVA